jgi:DNA-binding NtrC family response regulator
MLDSLAGMLCRASRVRPPVVMIHDLHLGDMTTRRFAERLVIKLAKDPISRNEPELRFSGLVIVALRASSTVSDHDLPFWAGDISHEILNLSGLDRDDVAAFLKSESVVERFTQLTGGNPRRLQSMLAWGTPDADSVVGERFRDLPEDARAVAMCAALSEAPAGPGVLKSLTRLSPSRLGQAVEEVLDSGLLAHGVVGGEIQLRFRSSSDQEALLQTASPQEIRKWRRRIGERLLQDGHIVAGTDQLLRAAEAGGLDFESEHPTAWGRLMELVKEAGEMLEVSSSTDQAAAMYRRCLDALDREGLSHAPQVCDDRDEIGSRLCRLLELRGEYAEALLIARSQSSEKGEPTTLRRIARLHLLQGDHARARETLQAALSQTDDRSAWLSARLMADIAELEFQEGNPAACNAAVEKAFALCGPQDAETHCDAALTAGKLDMVQGRLGRAAESYRSALKKARAGCLPAAEVKSLVNLGIVHLKRGEHLKAQRLYAEALEASERYEDARHQAFCLQNLAVLAHWSRDYATALSRFHEAVRAFQHLGNKPILAWLALDLGELYLEVGHHDRAEAMAQLSRELHEPAGDSSLAIYSSMLRGRLAVNDGRYLKAKHLFMKARQAARDLDRRDDEIMAGLELARLNWTLGDGEGAEQALAEAGEPSTAKLKAKKKLLQGEMMVQQSDPSGRILLLEALHDFEEAGDPDGQWRCQALLAEAAVTENNRADQRRWRRGARRTELEIRKTVPPELLELYMAAGHRRSYLDMLADPREERPRGEAAANRPQETYSVRTASAASQAAEAAAAGDGSEEAKEAGRAGARALSRLVGEHPTFRTALKALERVAPLDSTVLIRGESGTGKELAARAIHALSPRADKPMVKVNCGALVETLLLSELFGHERGAFTGATRRKKGRFELAEGGTLFLDEIGDISPRTQIALLRVLQEKVFERVGGTESIEADVRIVCATNRNLEEMVKAGTFREDLYYRLQSLQIDLPSLRDRGRDILLIAREILADLAVQDASQPKGLDEQAQELLQSHTWPGNVRELENVLRSCWIFAEGSTISADLVSQFVQQATPSPTPGDKPRGVAQTAQAAQVPLQTGHEATNRPERGIGNETVGIEPSGGGSDADTDVDFEQWYRYLLDEEISLRSFKKRVERECIERALVTTGGNITKAARLLGMKRPRLSQLVKEHDLGDARDNAKKKKASKSARD